MEFFVWNYKKFFQFIKLNFDYYVQISMIFLVKKVQKTFEITLKLVQYMVWLKYHIFGGLSMERIALQKLMDWNNNKRKKPLIIFGGKN